MASDSSALTNAKLSCTNIERICPFSTGPNPVSWRRLDTGDTGVMICNLQGELSMWLVEQPVR